jgi:hypothetical protein
MKIALFTSGDERCGIAEYGKNLQNSIQQLKPDIEWLNYYHNNPDISSPVGRFKETDIVVINYEPGLFTWLTASTIRGWKSYGKKMVLILHTSHEGDNRTEFTNTFDRVIVHEKTQDGFTYIPMGITDIDFEESNKSGNICDFIRIDTIRIGTAGFPFNWKGFHPLAIACQRFGFQFRCIMPESRHVDIEPMRKVILEANPSAEIITDWLPEREVIQKLHDCHVNVFAYEGGNLGISGAVRLGIAAKRPLVISKCRQFRDLIEDYSDEVIILEEYSVEGIIAAIGKAIGSKRIPDRIIRDMNWKVVGEKYVQVFKELVG